MSLRKEGERRRLVRYALKSDVFLVFRPAFDRLGTLKDVSMGGVAFEYTVLGDYHKAVEVEVDIFASQPGSFVMRQVPCQVIYDVRLERSSLSGVETRRCGVKFEHLSPRQRQLLRQLLGNFGSRPLRGEKPEDTIPISGL